jgi:hypothetical protein
MPGPTAADRVHASEVSSRLPDSGVRRAPVPVRRRRVVRRRHALPRIQSVPQVIHRVWQPGLGALLIPLHGSLVLLPDVVNTSQRMRSVRVPLPSRLLQKRNALLSPGLATADESFGQEKVPRCTSIVRATKNRAVQSAHPTSAFGDVPPAPKGIRAFPSASVTNRQPRLHCASLSPGAYTRTR